MFLRLVMLGTVFATLAVGHVWAGDFDLPDAPAAPQTTPASSLDEPIRQIADTPAGCAVLDKDFPGLRQHSMYDFFKSMTLNQIAALSKGQITQEMLAQAQTDLLAMKTSGISTDALAPAAPIATPAAVAATQP